MKKMGFEIDFLPVGNGDKSGDAIAVRYGTVGNYKILVYDGGTKESGEALISHIKKYYETTRVDYVISSHPDSDHAAGLSIILEQLDVKELWIHRPWSYSSLIQNYFKDRRITNKILSECLKEKMAAAYELERLARKKKIVIKEPYQGAQIDRFLVLSPQKDWYIKLIADFEKSPEQKKAEISLVDETLNLLVEPVEKFLSWVKEQFSSETLREDVETSAENESSVVLYAEIDGKGILLTGDVGIKGLTAAVDFTEANGIDLPRKLDFIQIPHHGSRHNVSSSLLDRLLGPHIISNDKALTKTGFVSSSKGSTIHPRRMVVNAFIRRGVNVFPTKGITIKHHHNMPDLAWSRAIPLEFSNEVESWG